MDSRASRRRGVTFVELLIVLAAMAVLAAVGFVRMGSAQARAYAEEVRATVAAGRFEAIRRDAPVAVRWDEGRGAFLAVVGRPDLPCTGDEIVARADAATHARVAVDTDLVGDAALVWLPSGTARGCDFASFPERIATLDDGRTSVDVTVTLTGRVTVADAATP
mgnify:FL=1